MKLQSIEFSKLGFRSLFTDYIRQNPQITQSFDIHPFRKAAAKARAEHVGATCDRDALADALQALHRPVTSCETVFRQIEALRDPESLVVVTGQQLTLFGGPLFTLYKIATAILYARRYSNELGRTVIPVFWLADEDHDVEEVRSVWVYDASGSLVPVSFPSFEAGRPVSEQYPSEASFRQVFEELDLVLPETDFRSGLMQGLHDAWSSPRSFRDAFAVWVLELFGEQGLILCGSHDPAFKELARPVFETYLSDPFAFYERVDGQTQLLLEHGYHQQVVPMESNLFFLDDGMRRRKMNVSGRGAGGVGAADAGATGASSWEWSIGDGPDRRVIDVETIVSESPNQLSPNVFLRPIVQDELLPVLAYVAGPSELSYYAQLQKVYPLFGKTMPMIVPRFSLTIVEPHISRAANHLPFALSEYLARTEDLESEYVKREDDRNLDAFFNDWIAGIQHQNENRMEMIESVDPTLVKAASRAETMYRNELMKLKGKLTRSLKQQEENQIARIHKVHHQLFPNNNLQEREVAVIHPLNKYGPEFVSGLMHTLEHETPDTHKFLFL